MNTRIIVGGLAAEEEFLNKPWAFAEEGESTGENGGGAGEESTPPDDGGAGSLPPDGSESTEGLEDLDGFGSLEAKRVFDYDPFSQEELDKRNKEARQKSQEKNEGDEGTPPKGEEGKAKTGEEAPKKEESDEVKQLKEQLHTYQQMLEQQLRGAYQPEGQKKTADQVQKEQEEARRKQNAPPEYPPFQIPQSIQAKLLSQDPQEILTGLGEAMQGVAMITHARVRAELRDEFENRLKETADSTTRELTQAQQAEQTKQEIQKDWAKTYPDLAGQDLQPLIASLSAQVAKEMGATKWSEELRDKIAARAYKAIGRQPSQESGNKGEENKGTTKNKGKPPYASSGSGRKGQPQKVNQTQEDIVDTLFGGGPVSAE